LDNLDEFSARVPGRLRDSGSRVRLKRYWSLIAHGPDEVELRHGVWNPVSVSLTDETRSGRLFRLLRRLDGSLRPEDIAHAEQVPTEEVQVLIDHLLEIGALETKPTSALDYYLDHLIPWRADPPQPAPGVLLLGDQALSSEIQRSLSGALPPEVVRIVANDDPGVRVLSDPDTAWLRDGLAFEEHLDAFASWRAHLVVAASTTLNPLLLRILNRVALALEIPWLPAVLDGPFLLLGPLVVPRQSPCFECLEMRVTMNLRESASYQRYAQALVERRVLAGELPFAPALIHLLAAHAALEVINYCLTGASFTIGKLLALHLPTMEFVFNEVLRSPSCQACGPTRGRDDTELYFDTATVLAGARPDAPR
jgi:bacteriocin biosynthesis cyclodehydratase domain-containing protein